MLPLGPCVIFVGLDANLTGGTDIPCRLTLRPTGVKALPAND